ncbi:MAG: diguanylate cyclase [Planctomycetes bacterium]|nr:diguanylate cyclase [Planctomycetota bacterium]
MSTDMPRGDPTGPALPGPASEPAATTPPPAAARPPDAVGGARCPHTPPLQKPAERIGPRAGRPDPEVSGPEGTRRPSSPVPRYGLLFSLTLLALLFAALTPTPETAAGAASRVAIGLLAVACGILAGILAAHGHILPKQEDPLLHTLSQQATHDNLTGLLNHRGILERFRGEIERAQREEQTLACLLVDVDNLKPVNDVLGHLAGDRLLRETARLFREACRPYDEAGRYGGDEFLLLVPNVGERDVVRVAERLRRRVEAHDFALPTSEHGISPTISVGIATYPRDGTTRAALVAAADMALYEAKRSGKNLVLRARERALEHEAEGGNGTATGGPAPLRTRRRHAVGRDRAEEPADLEVRRRPPLVPEKPGPMESGHGERILVIDDEPDTRQMVRVLLEGQGYRVLTVEGGAEALRLLAAESVDLILLDLAMPDMDGFHFCAELDQSGRGRGIPIVVLTALDTFCFSDEVLAGLTGVRHFLYKPLHLAALLDGIRRALAAQPVR